MNADPIRTARLVLLPATAAVARADLEGREALARALGVRVPAGWPPELYDEAAIRYTIERLEAHPEQAGWWLYHFARAGADGEPEELVGAGGYVGPPDEEGTVEVGYSVVPEHRRQGYAAETTRGLVARAFAYPEVARVIAHTLPDLRPSIGVLEKCGFSFDGPGPEEGTVRYVLTREAYARG